LAILLPSLAYPARAQPSFTPHRAVVLTAMKHHGTSPNLALEPDLSAAEEDQQLFG